MTYCADVVDAVDVDKRRGQWMARSYDFVGINYPIDVVWIDLDTPRSTIGDPRMGAFGVVYNGRGLGWYDKGFCILMHGF
ncbi:hypothetical protein SERLA73DRAFT_187170 [Serpula lacrymans var. lacrymans S7.3]|uniref:Uncharacterized protein n=1 Tax=Serpula lacrymans var. lacrymans (strain S7.3) TaxID=936435 RepID=F8Q8L0_SERL3|nr:hypothetical protein SERLA73DRAFT_187170 [Serpula lacrymans var. lacrymans S7.3]